MLANYKIGLQIQECDVSGGNLNKLQYTANLNLTPPPLKSHPYPVFPLLFIQNKDNPSLPQNDDHTCIRISEYINITLIDLQNVSMH